MNGWRPANTKHFPEGFPVYSDSMGLFEYYDKVMLHCLQWQGYVPPPFTVRPEAPNGIWWDCFTLDQQKIFRGSFGPVLLAQLKHEKRKLIDDPIIHEILKQDKDVYAILYDLLQWAGHPRLCAFPENPREPMQDATMKLSKYIHLWRKFLRMELLRGAIWSD